MPITSASENDLFSCSERLTGSAAFTGLFREGMDLVEETAATRRRWPERGQGARAFRQPDLCDRKHASDDAADETRIVALAPSRRGGRP